ncbi:MAG: heparinase II/III-family protein [Armatimonadetes bacterium]|nr:heparinase II/III-family protein [Armatimonadota bacterium]
MTTTRLATTAALGLAALLWGWSAMAAGQAVGIKHPVLDHKFGASQVEALQNAVAPLMAMSDQQALAFVPPHGYAQYVECPKCYGGVEGNGVLTWSFDRPEELKCRFCKTVVFPNPDYPENRTLTGKNMLGETISYNYYFGEGHQAPHFMSTHLWMHKRAWLIARTTEAAKLSALTGKPEYARRVAIVLDAFANAYPHYPVLQNGPRRFAFKEQKLHWTWDCGRWNFFHNEIPVEILPAYDLVYDSPVLDELSKTRGYDVREKIERDFIKAAAEGAIARKDEVSNVSGYDIRSAALAGRIINDPPLVHWAYAEMVKHVDHGFFRDGVWKEGTPSYHAMTIGGLKYSFDAVRGYSDPPGYKDPQTGKRLDNVQPEADLPLWGRCQTAPELVGLPNGCSSCIHDTHPYERRSAPRDRSVSTILPGAGQVSLGRGRQANQMLAQLHFSGGYGHQHCDNLNLMLWAKERELLPDVGYTWTQMRYWATSSLGHNLVVVDRKDQNSGPPGNLQLYLPGDVKDPTSPQISAVEASAEAAYSGIKGLDLYRRLLVMVPVSADDAYLVDVFRVRGGKTHDWTLEGDADRDTTADCSLPLSGSRKWLLEEGEEWKEPTLEGQRHNPYGMVRDVAEGQSQGDFEVRFTEPGEAARGLKSWVRAGGACQVLLGRSPSVRRMGQGSNADMRKGYDFWMPKLVVRRTGDDPLMSIFAAVHEPYAGQGYITSVKRLKMTPEDGLAVALQVEHAGGTDTILSALPGAAAQEVIAGNGVRLTGRLGVVRQRGGKIVGAWLIDGTSLAGSNWAITAQAGGYEGEISATAGEGGEEPAFLTTSALPDGNTLAGRWLIATYPGGITQGYEIKSVKREGEQTRVILADDPAVRIGDGKAEETCFPHRKFTGPVRFHIAGVAALAAQSNGPLQAQVTAPTEFKLPQ